MTFSPDAPQLTFSDVDSAVERLRESGLRVSTSRRLVLNALFAADGPVSAERIAEGVGEHLPRQDVASVYRNLQTFAALGLVRHLHLPHGPGLYLLAGGAGQEYLACERCGTVVGVEPARLDAVRDEIHKAFGYTVRFSHSPVIGLCPGCAELGDGERGDPHVRR